MKSAKGGNAFSPDNVAVYPVSMTSGIVGLRERIDVDKFTNRVKYLLAEEVYDRKRHDRQVRDRVIAARALIREKGSIVLGITALPRR